MTRSPQLKRVQAVRTTLLLDQSFFAVPAMQLRLIEDPTCDTAWTDGSSVGFSPTYVDTLSQDELIALLAHEVLHCACGHPWRRGSRERRAWNIACDYAINGILDKAGFKLPPSALLDSQYDGRWSEWIYDRLPKYSCPQGGQGQGNDPSGMGEVRDAPCGGYGRSEADWQQLMKQATHIAAVQGKLPSGLKRELDQLSEPRVDWRSLLRRYIQEVVRADYSWTRPNVRYLASGLFLPALHSIACGKIVVAIDTSGSIDQVLLAQFGTELQAIASELQPSSVDVMYCDSKVHRIDTFDRGDCIVLNPAGGGGTSFVPVFEAVDASDQPAVLVYLTDLYGTFPETAPGYPVVWAVWGNKIDAPFGDVVVCQS